MSYSDTKAPSEVVTSCQDVHLSIRIASTKLAPGEFLQGEVRVEVPSTLPDGIPYHSLRLSLQCKESNKIQDDQAEYDNLLEGYTADRVYLSRNVTLAGFRPLEMEKKEVEEQAKQELLFMEHHATPYARVIPAASLSKEFAKKHRDLKSSLEKEKEEGEPTSDEEGRRSARVLMPGEHRYPFGFRLPPWLPPSYYFSTHQAKGKMEYTASVALIIVRHFDNYTDEHHPTKFTNTIQKEMKTSITFFVLSTMSKRQLLRAYKEAGKDRAGVPSSLSARYQIFKAGCFGNMCCFNSNGGIEVEIEVTGSRALLTRWGEDMKEMIEFEQARTAEERTGKMGKDSHPPIPAEYLPIKVYVRNENTKTTIPAVRVELVEKIDIFKPLEAAHTLRPSLAKVQYKRRIRPGESIEWEANLLLPKVFRRCKKDGSAYLPPPGVLTANIKTYLDFSVSFPGLHTYIEEEDWDTQVLHIAELLDSSNQVLNLPVKYS